MVTVQRLEETKYSIKDVLVLLQDSFQEHLKEGIHYSLLSYSLDDFIAATKGAIVLVAADEDDLLGSLSLFLYDVGSKKWAYNDFWGVSNKARRMGIGSLLIEEEKRICKEYGCEYMISNTSVRSESSKKGHIKNGYKIVGYQGCAVYTYLFRMQFKHPSIYDSAVIRFFCRLFSGLKMVSAWNPNGYHRKWVKVLRREK